MWLFNTAKQSISLAFLLIPLHAYTNTNLLSTNINPTHIVPKEVVIPTKKITEEDEKAKTIIVKNNIAKKDTYKTKFFMRHYPEEFKIKVNGKELENGQEAEIITPDKKFSVQYSYIWNAPWGKITGTKQVNYKLEDNNVKKIDLHFSSWDDEYRIKASNAKPVNVESIESSGSREKPKKKSRRKNKKRVKKQLLF